MGANLILEVAGGVPSPCPSMCSPEPGSNGARERHRPPGGRPPGRRAGDSPRADDATGPASPDRGATEATHEGRDAALRRPGSDAAIELLRRWREQPDAENQKQTLECLRQLLDQDRPSTRKLFP
ncbi:MAG: hypothetical protein D6725_17820 [Planctomycetota bacterium]|nr:MAG: hypothetical protein D6725_17820 [Planctomycetota bacterium]